MVTASKIRGKCRNSVAPLQEERDEFCYMYFTSECCDFLTSIPMAFYSNVEVD